MIPELPIPPYRRALAALSNANLNFAYQYIGKEEGAFPGLSSLVVNVAGAPFSKPYLDVAWSTGQVSSGKHAPLNYVLEELDALDGQPSAIVFRGGEPLVQSNAMRHLCKLLKHAHPRAKLKVDTTGYYAEALSDVGKNVDYLSLEILAPLSPEAYAAATNFHYEPVLIYSAVEKAMAFLKLARCFKEVMIPVTNGVNDCPDCLATIAEEASFADLLVVKGVQARDGSKWSAKQLVEHAGTAGEYSDKVAVEYGGVRKRLK